jgi:hypothetical protein
MMLNGGTRRVRVFSSDFGFVVTIVSGWPV